MVAERVLKRVYDDLPYSVRKASDQTFKRVYTALGMQEDLKRRAAKFDPAAVQQAKRILAEQPETTPAELIARVGLAGCPEQVYILAYLLVACGVCVEEFLEQFRQAHAVLLAIKMGKENATAQKP